MYETFEEAFHALEHGEAELAMASQHWLYALTNYYELSGYKANLVFDLATESFFGFNNNEVVLRSIIDKALRLIDVKGISSQWIDKTYNYKTKPREAQRPWFVGTIFLLLFVLILLAGFFKNTAVQRRARRR